MQRLIQGFSQWPSVFLAPALALIACVGFEAAVGVGAVISPVPVIAVAIVLAVLVWPVAGLLGYLTLEATGLLWLHEGISSSRLTTGGYVLLIAGGAGCLRRAGSSSAPTRTASLWLVGFMTPGVLIGASFESKRLLLAAIALVTAPLLAWLVASVATPRELVILFKGVAVLCGVNAVVALWEVAVGQTALLAHGLHYGTQVRTIGATLRAPGLTVFNVHAGLLAGVVLLWTHAEWRSRMNRISHRWILFAASSGAALLLLSTARSALALVVVGVVVAELMVPSRHYSLRFRIVTVVLSGALLCAFILYGAAGGRSLLARIDVWRSVIDRGTHVFGSGLGTAGSATISSTALGVSSPTNGEVTAAFVDNYWLSLLVQIGWWGLAGTVVVCARMWVISRRAARAGISGFAHVCGLLAGIYAAALVVEVWEYTLPMAVAAIAVAACLPRQSTEDAAAVGPLGAEFR